jgi:hypothetical protein
MGFSYETNRYQKETIKRFAEKFRERLIDIIDN